MLRLHQYLIQTNFFGNINFLHHYHLCLTITSESIPRLIAQVYSSRLKILHSPLQRTSAISWGIAFPSGFENGAKYEQIQKSS